jgi:DNA-binding response OmpR family regulator/cellulose synthase/poly-beta-1,6-N-acetylglucosamine synthase-like glycosyltransferase
VTLADDRLLDPTEPAAPAKGAVLVVDDDEMILALVSHGLRAAGYDVTTAESGTQALQRLAEAVPDVIVSDVNMPDMDGFSLVRELRQDEALRSLPLVFLTSRAEADDVVSGLGLGADDYLTKPFSLPVLVARVEAKRLRPPVPVERLRVDRRTGLSGPAAFLDELARERERAGRSGRPGHVAVLSVHEAASVALRFGPRGADELRRQLGDVLASSVDALETAGLTEDGSFALLLPESDGAGVERRLQRLTESIATARPTVGGERVSITPVVGFASLEEGADGEQALQWAGLALQHAATHLDLRPVAYVPQMLPAYVELTAGQPARAPRPLLERLRTPLQIAVTVLVGMVVPYALYLLAHRAGVDVVSVAYVVVVVSLLVTGAAIWVEGLLALDPVQPPPAPPELDETAQYPPATALVAAYLPNEAATVVETVEAFLRVDYPGDYQVVLAYNTPVDLPVEAVLARIADRDPRLVLVRVPGSSSKAQNVNAAMAVVTGEFTGVFDADHHPEPDSFRRAWRWIADGYDVVQGHPVVRNGDASWVARTVAVEFEMIYGVSHPGRARLHGFGIFGGSNGYWRTELLRQTRFRGSMMTEDIDSALRVVEAGHRIGSDPYLITRELAPTTLSQLWDQRMRWAQGWFQVSLGHLRAGLRSRTLTTQQKLGFLFLLGWREVYPWLSLQMFPVVAFYLTVGEDLDWFVPVFVLTTLFTTSVGPSQTLFAYRQADPEIRKHRRWFLAYLVVATVFYTEWKNVIGRVAQVKQLMRETSWKVTPRTAGTAPRRDAS